MKTAIWRLAALAVFALWIIASIVESGLEGGE